MPPVLRSSRGRRSTNWPDTLAFQILKALREPAVLEYRFHDTRKWRFDVAIECGKLAIEVDGGGFVNGRHSRGIGIENDCEKYAEAMALGWRVLRVTPKQVQSGQALIWIEKLLRGERTGAESR